MRKKQAVIKLGYWQSTGQFVQQRWLRSLALLGVILGLVGAWHTVLAQESVEEPKVELASIDAIMAPNDDDEIVYFDSDHVIRVFDPYSSSDFLTIEWASPSGGWADMALGDLTGDGDMEIVAIRPEGAGGRLTIFDPVAQDSPADQVQVLNGIPWATLFDLELPSIPRLIATGNFDADSIGLEILYSYAVDDEFDRFVILRSTGEGAPGRNWEELTSWDLEGRWSAVATGNVYNDDAIDEVALVSNELGELVLLRVLPEVEKVFSNINVNNPWTDVALGQYVVMNNDGDEIGAVRDAQYPLGSAWVFRTTGENTFVDVLGERILPSPSVVFFVDIRGNGDDELVLLREARQELGPRARLILRDGNNNDNLTLREELLDGDNQYRGGDGGDVDGDGLGEIVLVRNNRIRIYTAPESSTSYNLIERFTNGRTVLVGNIDAAGFASRARLFASQYVVNGTLTPGRASGPTTTITLADSTRGTNLPFTYVIENAEEWVNVSASGATTPATLSISFRSDRVDPGMYYGRIVVDVATTDVENDPVVIELALVVEGVIDASPPSVSFVYFPCEGTLEPRDQVVELSAASALTYTAQIEGNPSWITVAPEAGILPESVTVSVDPALRPDEFVNLNLLVTVDTAAKAGVVNRVPIVFACASARGYLPSVMNE